MDSKSIEIYFVELQALCALFKLYGPLEACQVVVTAGDFSQLANVGAILALHVAAVVVGHHSNSYSIATILALIGLIIMTGECLWRTGKTCHIKSYCISIVSTTTLFIILLLLGPKLSGYCQIFITTASIGIQLFTLYRKDKPNGHTILKTAPRFISSSIVVCQTLKVNAIIDVLGCLIIFLYCSYYGKYSKSYTVVQMEDTQKKGGHETVGNDQILNSIQQ